MKSAIILSLTLLSALGSAAPKPTASSSVSIPEGDVNFSYFKIPQCAKNGEEHVESHGQVPNGRCVSIEWLRSILYFVEFDHSHCEAKFFADEACSADKELPQPLPVETIKLNNFYPDCWDDLTKLQPGVGDEDLVRRVNMTVTCV